MSKKINLQPLGDRILVRAIEAEQVTAAGIVIPDTATEKPQRGQVLAVGDGRYEDGKRVELDVAVGDEIIYSKYGGTEVNVEGEDLLILRESDVLAKAV
jgi:chaperonin GroES